MQGKRRTDSKRLRGALALSLVAGSLAGVGLLGSVPAQGVVQGVRGFIAFTSNQTGAGDIYVLDPEVANPPKRLVVSNAAPDRQPAWSPTGDQLAFSSERADAGGDIFRLSISGGVVTPLTSGPAADDHAAFREAVPARVISGTTIPGVPERIGYTSGATIEERNADGTGAAVTQVSHPGFVAFGPTYSPDDTLNADPQLAGPPELAYITDLEPLPPFVAGVCEHVAQPGQGTVFSEDEGGNACPIDGSTVVEGEPAWSPNRSHIAYASNRHGNFEIYVYDNSAAPGAGGPTRLTNDPAEDSNPTWSPDGTRIAFTRNLGGTNKDIFRMNADGTGLVNLTNTPTVNEDHADWGTYRGTLPAVPLFSVAPVTVAEGDAGTTTATFTISLDPPATGTVDVNYATSDGTATAGSDYTATTGTATFTAGQTTRTFGVTVAGDTAIEGNETFTVTLSDNSAGTVISTATASGTITNDDNPAFSVAPVTVTEGNAGTTNATFTVTASPAPVSSVSVNYATSNGTATAGSDYAATTGTASFAAGQTTATFNVPVNGDTVVEGNETFTVTLSGNSPGTVIATPTAAGTITNDDIPAFSIAPATVTEGNAGTTNVTFTVTASPAPASTVSVAYATSDGTATAGSDYTATSGSLSFTAGATTRTFTVPVTGDTVVEPNETFTVTLSGNSPGTAIATGTATGTITNDDSPAFSVAPVTVTEGNAGTTNATFTITANPVPTATASVNYATSDGTATAGSDYTATSGTATFAAGQTTATFVVPINGDATVELNETFTVTLAGNSAGTTIATPAATGTITNDDSPNFSVAPVTVTEGNAGTTNATFTITASPPPAGTASVNYATANGTATSGSDYAATSGTAAFTGGQTTVTFTVAVSGDTVAEADETFTVNLSGNSAGTTIATASATGTITNDDFPALSIADGSVTETDSGAVNATFTVTANPVPAAATTVSFATADGSATAGSDYSATSGTASFAAGQATATITVPVTGDVAVEGNETFTITLSGPTAGATIADGSATVTIADNDLEAATGTAGTASTEGAEGDGATAAEPIEATVTRPGGGTVSVVRSNGVAGTLAIQGYAIQVIADPVADAAAPLRIELLVDMTVVPAGQTDQTLAVFKDGVLVPNCAAGNTTAANPNPCVLRAMSAGGDVQLTVLSTTASRFTFGPGLNSPGGPGLFLVVDSSTSLPAVGGGTFTARNEDVIRYDGAGAYEPIFDGSRVGLSDAHIDALAFDGDDIIMSFTSGFSVPGVSGTTDDSDLVRFRPTGLGSATAGTFTLYFDGSDIGLTTSDEDIDAIEILDGDLHLSTTGSFSASSGSSRSGKDEDVVVCEDVTTGSTSRCQRLTVAFDGSEVGLGVDDLDGIAADAARSYFSTTNAADTDDVSAEEEDVFSCLGSFAACDEGRPFALHFEGSRHGIADAGVGAIEVVPPRP